MLYNVCNFYICHLSTSLYNVCLQSGNIGRQEQNKQFICARYVLCDSINLLSKCLLSAGLRLGFVGDSQFVP